MKFGLPSAFRSGFEALGLLQALVPTRTLNTSSARGINLASMIGSLFAEMWVYTKISVAFATDIAFRKKVSWVLRPMAKITCGDAA
jgi:hypothetical protein